MFSSKGGAAPSSNHTFSLISKEPGSLCFLSTQLEKPVGSGISEDVIVSINKAQRVYRVILSRDVSILIDEVLIQENEFLVFKVSGINKQAVGGVLGSRPWQLSTPPT